MKLQCNQMAFLNNQYSKKDNNLCYQVHKLSNNYIHRIDNLLPNNYCLVCNNCLQSWGLHMNSLKGYSLHKNSLKSLELHKNSLKGYSLHKNSLKSLVLHKNSLSLHKNSLKGYSLHKNSLKSLVLHKNSLSLHKNSLKGYSLHKNSLKSLGLHNNNLKDYNCLNNHCLEDHNSLFNYRSVCRLLQKNYSLCQQMKNQKNLECIKKYMYTHHYIKLYTQFYTKLMVCILRLKVFFPSELFMNYLVDLLVAHCYNILEKH